MKLHHAKHVILFLSMSFGFNAMAQLDLAFNAKKPLDLDDYPKIYPFVPKLKKEIYQDVQRVSEDANFIKNFREIVSKNLSKASTKIKPWTASYWPLNKGTVADPYENTKALYYLDVGWVAWKNNYDSLKDRLTEELARVDTMSEEELAKLAPSEKYDILIGDKSFDLTKRLWKYMNDWGSAKLNAFITDLRLVDPEALTRAEQYASWGWLNSSGVPYKNAGEVFKDYVEFQGSLSAENALTLVQSGMYKTVQEAFPAAVEMAEEQEDDYVLAKQSSFMAAWEGICNGWSTAAGIVPRPRRAISFELPDGRKLRFYPSDIRGLVSLFWVNSLIQDNVVRNADGTLARGSGGTLSAGLRCNTDAKEDGYGRLYDNKPDPFNLDHSPRCSGVHPATWHMGLVNLIGKQGRSFIVERKVGAPVDNHPMYAYEFKYFNPNTGYNVSSPMAAVVSINKNDQFRNLRHKDARYIVGVEATMIYLDYATPHREDKNSEADDYDVDKKMFYDLELDEDFNIVGGQWRGVKVGRPRMVRTRSSSRRRKKEKRNHNQPDFFWVITKDWKKTGLFKNATKLPNGKNMEKWQDHTKAPPKSWLPAAHSSHGFMYHNKYSYGTGLHCNMVNQKTGELRAVPCEKSTNKPQPLINVLNVLIERSSKQ